MQQAQGRVKPTMQMKDGVPVNDDAGQQGHVRPTMQLKEGVPVNDNQGLERRPM